MTSYKGYQIKVKGNEAHVYKNGKLSFCTMSDDNNLSATEKAKNRIDKGMTKMSKTLSPREAYNLLNKK